MPLDDEATAIPAVAHLARPVSRVRLHGSTFIRAVTFTLGLTWTVAGIVRALRLAASCKQKLAELSNLLRGFLNQTPLPKEPAGKPKDAWTVASHNLFEGRLVTFTRPARQLQVRGLFVTIRQEALPGSNLFRMADPREISNPPSRFKG